MSRRKGTPNPEEIRALRARLVATERLLRERIALIDAELAGKRKRD